MDSPGNKHVVGLEKPRAAENVWSNISLRHAHECSQILNLIVWLPNMMLYTRDVMQGEAILSITIFLNTKVLCHFS